MDEEGQRVRRWRQDEAFFLKDATRDLPRTAAMVVWVGGWSEGLAKGRGKTMAEEVQALVAGEFGMGLPLVEVRRIWRYLGEIAHMPTCGHL